MFEVCGTVISRAYDFVLSRIYVGVLGAWFVGLVCWLWVTYVLLCVVSAFVLACGVCCFGVLLAFMCFSCLCRCFAAVVVFGVLGVCLVFVVWWGGWVSLCTFRFVPVVISCFSGWLLSSLILVFLMRVCMWSACFGLLMVL